MPTPLRAIRVASPLWEAARIRAAETGTSVSAVIVAALEAFTAQSPSELSPPPQAPAR